MQAKFISVEGADGCGKTTQVEFVVGWLQNRGVEITRTREPGGTALGEKLRELILHQNYNSASEVLKQPDSAMCVDAELLLMFAARAQHLAQVIKPALAAGRWVVCDRFTDSTYAYQGGGRGIHTAQIALLEQKVIKAAVPDLTILLDAAVETCAARTGGSDVFEREGLEFQHRVAEVYKQRAGEFPQRIKLVDANKPISDVQTAIAEVLAEFCNHHRA